MTGTCCYCGAEIMKTGDRWYNKRTADVNGYCPKSQDDLHSPEPSSTGVGGTRARLVDRPAQTRIMFIMLALRRIVR